MFLGFQLLHILPLLIPVVGVSRLLARPWRPLVKLPAVPTVGRLVRSVKGDRFAHPFAASLALREVSRAATATGGRTAPSPARRPLAGAASGRGTTRAVCGGGMLNIFGLF